MRTYVLLPDLQTSYLTKGFNWAGQEYMEDENVELSLIGKKTIRFKPKKSLDF